MDTKSLGMRKLLGFAVAVLLAASVAFALALTAEPSKALAEGESSSATAESAAAGAAGTPEDQSATASDAATEGAASSESADGAAVAEGADSRGDAGARGEGAPGDAGARGEGAPGDAGAQDIATPPLGGLPLMGGDYVWFGRDLELRQTAIENDILAAGQIVNLHDCAVAGNIRAAGQSIAIVDTATAKNITVAGQDITIQGGSANAIAAAASTISIGGSCKELTAFGENVTLNGTVEGDVNVEAESVELGPNARIKGTLYVTAASNPVMQKGAEVANVEFSQASSNASTDEIESAFAGLLSLFLLTMIIVGIFGTFLVAILAEWLFSRHTAAAASMIRTRTGAHIGTGVVGAIAAPIAIVILFSLVFTWPVAGALTFALIAMSMVAGGFAGASLFKLAFPRLGRYKCAMAGGAIMGVASAIPYLGSLVHAAAFMYLLGYALQSIYLGVRSSAPTPMPDAIYSNGPVEPIRSAIPTGSAGSTFAGAPMASTVPVASSPSAPSAPYAQPVAPSNPASSASNDSTNPMSQ